MSIEDLKVFNESQNLELEKNYQDRLSESNLNQDDDEENDIALSQDFGIELIKIFNLPEFVSKIEIVTEACEVVKVRCEILPSSSQMKKFVQLLKLATFEKTNG